MTKNVYLHGILSCMVQFVSSHSSFSLSLFNVNTAKSLMTYDFSPSQTACINIFNFLVITKAWPVDADLSESSPIHGHIEQEQDVLSLLLYFLCNTVHFHSIHDISFTFWDWHWVISSPFYFWTVFILTLDDIIFIFLSTVCLWTMETWHVPNHWGFLAWLTA